MIQIFHYRKFDFIFTTFFAVRWFGADEDIHIFRFNAIRHFLLHLLACQMRQQIGDDKFRIIRRGADGNTQFHHFPIPADADGTTQLQRDCRPLVFFDAAIIMGFEICHIFLFIKRHRADINPWGIQMRSRQADAFGKAFLPNNSQCNAFFTVDTVNPVAGLQCHAALIGGKSCVARQIDHSGHRFAFGFADVQKGFIPFGIVGCLVEIHPVKGRFFAVKEFFRSHCGDSPFLIICAQTVCACASNAGIDPSFSMR